jgi:preprotein translocase subunit SecG
VLQQVLLVIHVLLALGITALVLLQRGKGADAGAGFGAGASGTVFGARGSSTFFSKTTAILATCFFVTSLWLAYLATQGPRAPASLIDQVPVPTVPAPATLPAPTGAALPAPAAVPSDVPALPAPAQPAPTQPPPG